MSSNGTENSECSWESWVLLDMISLVSRVIIPSCIKSLDFSSVSKQESHKRTIQVLFLLIHLKKVDFPSVEDGIVKLKCLQTGNVGTGLLNIYNLKHRNWIELKIYYSYIKSLNRIKNTIVNRKKVHRSFLNLVLQQEHSQNHVLLFPTFSETTTKKKNPTKNYRDNIVLAATNSKNGSSKLIQHRRFVIISSSFPLEKNPLYHTKTRQQTSNLPYDH